jgi:DNA-binding transcriptional MerR regulator
MNTNELCRSIGISLRQAQWWCEAGVLRPAYIGNARSFDAEQVLIAALVKELRRKGVSLQQARKVVAKKPQGDFLVITPRSRLWCSKENVLACVASAACACLVVSLEDLRRLHGSDV